MSVYHELRLYFESYDSNGNRNALNAHGYKSVRNIVMSFVHMGTSIMFEVFSRSYYLGRLFVTPTDSDCALMHSEQHERINEEVYATGEGIERLDAPLVMKLESGHFPVHAAVDVPANTLAVPESMLEGTRIRNPPTLHEVFLARRERAEQLLGFNLAYRASESDQSTSTLDRFDPSNVGT